MSKKLNAMDFVKKWGGFKSDRDVLGAAPYSFPDVASILIEAYDEGKKEQTEVLLTYVNAFEDFKSMVRAMESRGISKKKTIDIANANIDRTIVELKRLYGFKE